MNAIIRIGFGIGLVITVIAALAIAFNLGYRSGQQRANEFLPPCLGSQIIHYSNGNFSPIYELSFPNGTQITVSQPNLLEPYANIFVECQK